jgi:DNA-binding CsgD family transcriptional regulator
VLGREAEFTAIARFLDGDGSGPRALLLEGAAGIGKTTLWREAVRLAESKGRVLVSRPSESETALSFMVLGDLLAAAVEEGAALERLPGGQRRALEAALLLGAPSRFYPDARAVSLAVLGVFRTLATDGPLGIAIDDVHCADSPSARALAFALRRLVDAPVVVLATRRVAPGLTDPLDLATTLAPSGSMRMTVGPIALLPLGRILRERLGGHLSPPLVKRIHEASGGNPFFALEIGRALGPDMPPPGEPLPVPSDLQVLLRRRLAALSDRTPRMLLVVAASTQPTVGLIESEDWAALQEAEDAEIVTVHDTTIEFTHPLFASTVYSSASSRARREVHARLARVATDTEERARHLALSSDGPDEDVARALDGAAMHAYSKGAPTTAAELSQLAVRLTPDGSGGRLVPRRTKLADYLFASGDVAGARELCDRMLVGLEPGPRRASVLYKTATTSWNDVRRVHESLTRALDDVGNDRLLRSRVLAELAWASLWRLDPASAISWGDAAIELAEEFDHPDVLGVALSARALAGCVMGHSTINLLERAISLEGPAMGVAEATPPRACLGMLQMWAGELDSARETLDVELNRYLDHGHETATWEVRGLLGQVEFRAGRWRLAAQHVAEAHDIAVEAGWSNVQGQVLPLRSIVACAMGDIRTARTDGVHALSVCERTGDRWDALRARAALGFLELSLGDPAACHAWLDPLVGLTEEMGLQEPGAFPFVPDEVEALVAMGELEAADRLTDRLEEQGQALHRALALATAARCRGQVAMGHHDWASAGAHLERAIHEHRSVSQPFELGRTLLAAGETRRRMRQLRPARDLLQGALETFRDVGAPLWEAKARSELGRIGGRAPAPMSLTPTEDQVAHLVADGRTNREVADALFMSVHTVDAHLRRIFRKLQVRSRTQLARKL